MISTQSLRNFLQNGMVRHLMIVSKQMKVLFVDGLMTKAKKQHFTIFMFWSIIGRKKLKDNALYFYLRSTMFTIEGSSEHM